MNSIRTTYRVHNLPQPEPPRIPVMRAVISAPDLSVLQRLVFVAVILQNGPMLDRDAGLVVDPCVLEPLLHISAEKAQAALDQLVALGYLSAHN